MRSTDPRRLLLLLLLFFSSPVRQRDFSGVVSSTCGLYRSLIFKDFLFWSFRRLTLKCTCSGLFYVCVSSELSGGLINRLHYHSRKWTCTGQELLTLSTDKKDYVSVFVFLSSPAPYPYLFVPGFLFCSV